MNEKSLFDNLFAAWEKRLEKRRRQWTADLRQVTGTLPIANVPPIPAAKLDFDVATQAELDTEAAARAAADTAEASTRAAADTALAAPQYLTLALTATLPNERRLVAGANISLTDGGAGADLTVAATGGAGTVTSVALALPAEISVSGSPVTAAGTLTGAWAVQAANKAFLGPAAGADATPGFRLLVAADIPLIDLSTRVTGILESANGGTGKFNTGDITCASDVTITGGGTLALGSYTLTVPASGTAALQATTLAGYGITDAYTKTASDARYAPIAIVGTVTSVALSVPSILSVAGSPVTTSGTLTVTLATQAANLVFAGPVSGGVATPAFRSLVAADIPLIDLTNKVTGVLPSANGGTGVNNAGTLTNASNTTITGGGTLALGGFTLTAPATGTAALLATTNTFSVAQTFSSDVTIAGGLNVGTATGAAAGTISVTTNDAATATSSAMLNLAHHSTGTPANGFGGDVITTLETASGAMQLAALMRTVWVDATNVSRKARMRLSTYDTAERQCLIFEASGTAPMLGLLGAAAVVRQTVTGVRTGTLAQLQTVVANLLTALANLGAVTDSTS